MESPHAEAPVVMLLMITATPKPDLLLVCFMFAFFTYTAWLLWKGGN